MSPLDSTDRGRGVSGPKPKADIYTVLLGISLGAILIAIICLAMELASYDWDLGAATRALDFRVAAAAPADTATALVDVVAGTGRVA